MKDYQTESENRKTKTKAEIDNRKLRLDIVILHIMQIPNSIIVLFFC